MRIGNRKARELGIDPKLIPKRTVKPPTNRSDDRLVGPGRWEIEIPGWNPPSVNRLKAGVYWAEAARIKTQAFNLIDGYCFRFGVTRATGKRRVSLLIAVTNRSHAPDPDNVWKALLDALKRCDAIVDDAAKWCELGPVRIVREYRKRTVITIEDVG